MNAVDRPVDQPQPNPSPRGQRWWLLFLLLLLLGMCGLAGTLFGQRRSAAAEPEFIPVSLHSRLEADYRADPNPAWLPGVRLDIIWDAIYDHDPEAGDLEARKAAVLNSLHTPVPVVTSSTCQGQHVSYASRDTWVDSANQTATHGADTRLQIGRTGDETQQILLYFPLTNTLPAGSFIDSARLELEPESTGGQLPPDSIQIFNLAAPFPEMTTTWANQPEPFLPYRSLELATVSIDMWDVTDIVQDWLLDYHQHAGILLLPSASSTDFSRIYFSREAGPRVNYQVSGTTDYSGPRLIVDCGNLPPEPEVVAAVTTTPTPIPTQTETGPTPPNSLPISTVTQPLPLPTEPLPQPTLPAPAATGVPLLPSPLPPNPTLPPPSPTTSPPPPTGLPPDEETDDEDPEDEPDPPPPRISINDVTVIESDTGSVIATFDVTLSRAATGQVTVDFAIVGNTATAGTDFDGSSGTLTFPPASTRQTITVEVLGDLLDEDDETFFVNLSNLSGATFEDSQGRGTITDDDPPPALTIDDVTVAEGNAGTVEAIFTVSLSAASGLPVTVDYSTADGSATAADVDYLSTAGSLNFPPGTISQTLNVTINGDTVVEENETVLVNLSNATSATMGDNQGTGTILNDDELTISIADVTVTEGNGGAVDAIFVVALSAASDQPVTVEYATADDTATAGLDYVAISPATLTFGIGMITRPITITINSDLLDELDETFFVNLSNPSSSTIFDGQGLGTITDDDDPPALSIDDVTITEGDSGTTEAVFTVWLDAPSSLTVTVDYATAADTASSPADFTAIPTTTLTFPPGVITQPVTLTVLGDLLDENDETFVVSLSNGISATISDGQGLGTIADDDDPPALAIDDVTVTEGDSGTTDAVFTVSLDAASSLTVTVDVASADNSALAPTDYLTATGTLTFTPGLTTQPFTVSVQGDTLDELDETFVVNLSGAMNASIGDGQGLGSITDDDGLCSAPDLTLTAVADTYLRRNQPDSNFGSDPDLRTRPLTSNSRSTLIQFDLAAIPPNSVVTCAALLLHQNSAPDPAQYAHIHRLTNSWTEGQATWITRIMGINWTIPGGDYEATIEATFVPSTTNHAVNVAPLTQFWIDNPSSNFGLLVAAENNGSNGEIQYTSRNVITPTLRPRLEIEYIPTLSINDVTVTEGESGSQAAVFTVTLSSASSETVTVDFATADNTATISNNDYEFTSGTLTFTTGITTQPVTVQIAGDTNNEPVESFFVNLSNPVNAAILDGQGEGIIQPDISGLSLPAQPHSIFLPLILK